MRLQQPPVLGQTALDLDGDIGTNEPVTIGKRDLAALRKAARAGETAAKEAADAKRSLAFMQAGVDPADKRLSYFAKAYDGEMTADAIRNAAVEAGFLQKNLSLNFCQCCFVMKRWFSLHLHLPVISFQSLIQNFHLHFLKKDFLLTMHWCLLLWLPLQQLILPKHFPFSFP